MPHESNANSDSDFCWDCELDDDAVESINTSKEKAEKQELKINGEKKEMYSILTYTMGNKRKGCINRDRNATLNMIEIVKTLIETKERPKEFQREKEKKIKSTNPT